MIIPIRCFSCGKPIADRYEAFKQKIKLGQKPGAALDEIGIKRYCCRRMVLSQVDLVEEIQQYPI